MSLTYGVAMRPIPGEPVSGDAYAVVEGQGFTTVLVIDGLGHGAGAAEAAARARALGVAAAEAQPEALLRTMDTGLVGTRGAVASVLRVEPKGSAARVSFCGIGNVGLSFQGRRAFGPISTPGILGRRVRKLSVFEHELAFGDRLALFTDGISSRFELAALPEEPQLAAEALLAQHGKPTDDALCLVLRWERAP